MAWKIGPMPPDTWGWGAVVPVGILGGFYFADFCGETVKVIPSNEILEPHEVAWFDNGIELPPASQPGTTRLEY